MHTETHLLKTHSKQKPRKCVTENKSNLFHFQVANQCPLWSSPLPPGVNGHASHPVVLPGQGPCILHCAATWRTFCCLRGTQTAR